jgi:hypothetical protein
VTFSSLHDYPRRGSHRPQRRADLRLDSPAQLALAGLALWLLGAIVHPLAVLTPLGLVLLLVAGAAYLLRPRRRTMYWRGRELDLSAEPGPREQLYHLLFKK